MYIVEHSQEHRARQLGITFYALVSISTHGSLSTGELLRIIALLMVESLFGMEMLFRLVNAQIAVQAVPCLSFAFTSVLAAQPTTTKHHGTHKHAAA